MSPQIELPTIENVVASSSIETELDVEEVASDLQYAEFNPNSTFPGLLYRISNPKAVCLLFRSGKVVCTGASSIETANEAISRLFNSLSDLGIETPTFPDITVQNIVSSGDLGCTLNLPAAAIGFGLENVEYEPEQFPGLIYRSGELNVVVLLFSSGKVVVTGGTSESDAEEAIGVITENLSDLDLLN